jgi:hypothetical protein
MNDERVVAFRKRVTVVPEPTSSNIAEWMTGGQWRGVPGGVDIHARGQIFSATADHSLGDPWTASTLFSDEQITSKFKVMVGLDEDGDGDGHSTLMNAAEDVIDVILTLDAGPIGRLADGLAVLARSMADSTH